MSKVIVVGDAFVSVNTLRESVVSMGIPEPVEIISLEWYADDSPEEVQRKLKVIEQNGPEAVAIPEGIMEELGDAEY